MQPAAKSRKERKAEKKRDHAAAFRTLQADNKKLKTQGKQISEIYRLSTGGLGKADAKKWLDKMNEVSEQNPSLTTAKLEKELNKEMKKDVEQHIRFPA